MSSLRLPSITSGQPSALRRLTLTLSFSDGINCRWVCSRMIQSQRARYAIESPKFYLYLPKRPHIVETEPFSNTFGPKAQRKRPRLDIGSIEELGESSKAGQAPREGEEVNEEDEEAAYHPTTSLMREPVYAKGTSRRIWGELYKVLDSSDVVIHVLDARDPLGTRCKPVVEYLRKEKAHKHLVYVLNKVDLVPTWVTVSTSSHAIFHLPQSACPLIFLLLRRPIIACAKFCIPPFHILSNSQRFHFFFISLSPLPHSSQVRPRPSWHSYAFGLLREWKNERFPPLRTPPLPRVLRAAAATKLSAVLADDEGSGGSRW